MSSGPRPLLFGLRLALWYATLFVAGSIAIVLVTYYLTKPFAFAELLARVQALVRRATRAPEPTTLAVEDVVLDLLSRRVTRAGQALDLRPREFVLLEYLMRNTGKVVSKTMILSHVWEYNFDPQTNIVDVLVSRLRDRIDRPFDKKLLQTVRGVGYVIRQ